MVFKSGYVVYRNQNPNEKQQDKVNNGGEQQADTLEKEYEEKIRKANMEMRREHGDQMDVDFLHGESAESKIEKVALTAQDMNGREAFFALMAMKMMQLAKKYQRKLEDLHSIFFMVSCDF